MRSLLQEPGALFYLIILDPPQNCAKIDHIYAQFGYIEGSGLRDERPIYKTMAKRYCYFINHSNGCFFKYFTCHMTSHVTLMSCGI